MRRLLVLALLALLALSVPVAAPSGVAAEGPRSCTHEERLVFFVYRDFLGREPDDAGLLYWAGALQSGSVRRTDLAYQLARSPEYVGVVVDGLYQDAFGRAPDPNGRQFWITQLQRGVRVAVAAGEFFGSPEFFTTDGGGSNPSWLAALYEEILQRPIDGAGQQYWQGQLAAGRTRSQVAAAIYQSEESRRERVVALYERFLDRGPDRAGEGYWAGVILSQDDLALAAFLAGSEEYLARARSVDPGCPAQAPTPLPPPGTNPPVLTSDVSTTRTTTRVQRGSADLEVFVTYPQQAGRWPLILVAHGAQNDGEQASQFSAFLARRGYVVAAPTLTGRTTRDQALDLSQILTTLTSAGSPVVDRIDPERVGAWGGSLGGIAILNFYNSCCVDPRIDAIVPRMAMAQGSGFVWSDVRTPLLMVHGDQDRTVPYSSGRSTFAAASPPKAFVTMQGYGHDLSGAAGQLGQAVSLAWFDGWLKGDPSMRSRIEQAVAGTSFGVLDWQA